MIKATFILSFILIFNNSYSQSNYNFEFENIPYQDLTNSISLNNGDVWDDPGYTIPIGFSFQLGSFTFDTIYILQNSLGGVLSSSQNTNQNLPFIVPIAQDIISLVNGGSSSSPISYQIDGEPGNQILKVEWKNFGFFNDSTEQDFMNMQLWLYEGTNTIEYRYGPNSINNPTESFEGLPGITILLLTGYDFYNDIITDTPYAVTGNPLNPSLIIIDFETENYVDGVIPSGMVYRFIPDNLSVTDIENNPNITIFPNPVTNLVNIKTSLNSFKITIYNTLGKIIFSDSNVYKINTDNFNSGIYFLKIQSKHKITTFKFVKK